MTIEDRLTAAFAEHQRAVGDARRLLPEVLERTSTRPAPWWHRPPLVVVGLAVVVALLALASGRFGSGDGDDTIEVAAPTMPAAEFDDAVEPICRDLFDAVNRQLVFETPEAYALIAGLRRDGVATALATMARLVDPADQPGLVADVVSDLRLAAEAAADAVEAVEAGALEVADDRLGSYGVHIGRAAEPLAGHGATACEDLVP